MVLLGYVNVVRWLFGSVPVATIDLAAMLLVVDGRSRSRWCSTSTMSRPRHSRRSGPALGLPDADIETLRYELVTLPAAWVRPAAVVGR